MNLNAFLLAENIGNILFRLIANLMPAVLISLIFLDITPPSSMLNFLLFLVSVLFGFAILYCISYIISLTSFWLINIWSLSTLKNVCISILSGTMIPLWFMPQGLMQFIKMTPFDAIYFIPITIYLGEKNMLEVAGCFFKQLIWIIILAMIGMIIWKRAMKHLVIQGG